MRSFKWVVLIFLVPLVSLASGGSCAEVEIKGDGRCESIKVNFLLKRCGSPSSSAKVHTTCKGEHGSSTATTSAGTYRVAFHKKEGWGTTGWEAKKVTFTPAPVKPKRAKRIVAATIPAPIETAEVKKEAAAEVEVEAGPVKAEAQETKEAEEDAGEGKLLGNWNGKRNDLAKRGITLGAFYTGEVVTNFAGGAGLGTTYMGKATLSLDVDLEKFMGANAWAFHASAIQLHGQGPSIFTGDFQVTSNMEATATSRLYDVWLQKSFADGNGSLLFGLYDWNSENNITDSSLAFLNSSFGMGAELSQAPVNGGVAVSTYPQAAVGLRLLLENNGAYVNTAVLDGVAGNPQDPVGTTIRLNADDGAFLATEVGYKTPKKDTNAPLAKYAMGAWMFTKLVDKIDNSGLGANYGFYFMGEQALSKHVALFARFGTASGVNQIHSNLAGGVMFNKLVNSFDNDQLGFGVTTAWNSQEYLDAQATAGTPTVNAETALEILYRFEPIPGFALQPDFQYVIHPGMDPNQSDAVNFFLRFDLSF